MENIIIIIIIISDRWGLKPEGVNVVGMSQFSMNATYCYSA